ncbi:RNA polymerase sigma factor [Aquimarina pacifica]|uniref:RNA polymerase sigma factor n=1 Tax=Aquimarina pacifica TaxID=1296415 RepID=UPI000471F65F|nr:sigma-70 family RNA polymerase sigma factor [Aquimarina pacifica]
MNNTEDQKILKGIVAGDEGVLTKFYKDNIKYIRPYILRNSGCEEDVEDVFQDGLVFIYQKLKEDTIKIEPSSSFRSYFFGVCKNIWRNRLRKNKRLVVTEDMSDDEEMIDPEVLTDIEDRDREHVYRTHFMNLSDTCREVLNLLFLGKSMKEISETTGYTEGYTRKKKFECKESLLQMIEKDPIYQELHQDSEKE